MPNLDLSNMSGNELDFMASQIITRHDHNFIYSSQSSANEGKFLANQYCTCSLSFSFCLSHFLLNADKAQFMKQIMLKLC